MLREGGAKINYGQFNVIRASNASYNLCFMDATNQGFSMEDHFSSWWLVRDLEILKSFI